MNFTVAMAGRIESAPGETPYISRRPRPFLEAYSNNYRLCVVPLDADRADVSFALKESDPECIALRKEHWIAGVSRPRLPLEFDNSIGKVDKRISRLLSIHDAGRALPESEVRIGHLRVGPATRMALEGAEVVISRSFLRRVIEPELDRWHELARAGGPDEMSEARRQIRRLKALMPKRHEVGAVFITVQTRKGHLKGHAIVRDRVVDSDGNRVDLLFPEDALKTEVRLTVPDVFVAVTKAKASRLRLDIQTLTMHGKDGFLKTIAPMIVTEYVDDVIDKLQAGRFHELLESLVDSSGPDRLRKLRGWPLLDFVSRGGDPGWFAWTVQAMGRAALGEIVAAADRIRIPVLNAERRYLYTDVRTGIPVERGKYRLAGDWGIIVNAVDYLTADPSFGSIHDLNEWIENGGDIDSLEPGIARRLGGMDQDDLVIVLGPFISRSPTMVGEWWFFEKMRDADPRFKDLDPSLLQREGPGVYDLELEPASKEVGRSKAALLRAGTVLSSNGSVVGRTALALRYAVAADMMPDAIPLGMEGIIDAASKALLNCEPIQEWATALIKKVAQEGAVPTCMRDEVARSAGVEPEDVSVANGHWLDELVEHIELEVQRAWTAVEEMADNAMPPLRHLEVYAPLDAGAAQFRRFHYEAWADAWQQFVPEGEEEPDDEQWTQMRQYVADECVEFLRHAPDPVGIVGATVRRIYLQRLMSLEPGSAPDAILFQEGVRDYLFEALERVGLLGEPQHDPDGFYELVWREPDPQALRWVVPVYGMWSLFLPDNPTKEDKKLARESDFSSWIVGLVVEAEMENGRDHRGTFFRPVFYVDGEWVGNGPRGHEMPVNHPTWVVEDVLQDGGAAILFLKLWTLGDPLPTPPVADDEGEATA